MEVNKDLNFLKEMSKLTSVKNCQDLKENGINITGEVEVDPDGPQTGEPPISVVCHEDGTTEIGQEVKEEIENCVHSGCHEVTVDYGASEQQIRNLIQTSESCSQPISFKCFSSALKFRSVNIGWWTGQDGM